MRGKKKKKKKRKMKEREEERKMEGRKEEERKEERGRISLFHHIKILENQKSKAMAHMTVPLKGG